MANSESRWTTRALALVLPLMLGAAACQSPEPVDQGHRYVVVKTPNEEEAFDVLVEVLLERFEGVDASLTSRADKRVVTSWLPGTEPGRLVRSRAEGSVRLTRSDGQVATFVQVEVIKQISTRKTEFGELDRQQAVWVVDADLSNRRLEQQILDTVKARYQSR